MNIDRPPFITEKDWKKFWSGQVIAVGKYWVYSRREGYYVHFRRKGWRAKFDKTLSGEIAAPGSPAFKLYALWAIYDDDPSLWAYACLGVNSGILERWVWDLEAQRGKALAAKQR